MISAPKSIFGPNHFRIFSHELGGPVRVAKFLGVSERTVRYWLQRDRPPRAAVLAMYWETQYGRSLVESDQINEIWLLYRRIRILESQYANARNIVAGLHRPHTGTANEAVFDELPDVSCELPNTWGLASPLDGTEPRQANAA